MNIFFDSRRNRWVDDDTGFSARSKTELMALIKSEHLGLPVHDFLSNRFILNNIGVRT